MELSKKLKTPFLGKEVRRSRTSFPKNGVFNFLKYSERLANMVGSKLLQDRKSRCRAP